MASVARPIVCSILLTDDNGVSQRLKAEFDTISNRIFQTKQVPGIVSRDSWVSQVIVSLDGLQAVKRGQLYADLILRESGHAEVLHAVCRGYLHDGNALGPEDHADSTEGPGFLSWVQEANDVAGNVATTVSLAAANAYRIVHGILVKYHCDGNSASRELTARIRDVADTSGPTGFAIDADIWVSTSVSMIANEEGIIYAKDKLVAYNDEGTITYDDQSTLPSVFPLAVDEGDTIDLIIMGEFGLAGDDYDVFVLYEEWMQQ